MYTDNEEEKPFFLRRFAKNRFWILCKNRMIVDVKMPKNGSLLCYADSSCKFMQKAHDSIRKHIDKHVTSTTSVRFFLYCTLFNLIPPVVLPFHSERGKNYLLNLIQSFLIGPFLYMSPIVSEIWNIVIDVLADTLGARHNLRPPPSVSLRRIFSWRPPPPSVNMRETVI